MYYIIGGDGKEYGPVSADQIRQWIAEGRLNAQSQVRTDGTTQWVTLGALPELAGLFGAPGPIAPPSANAPGASSSGLHEGDYELDILGCIGRAWNFLTANFWPLVGGSAVYLLIIGGLSGFAQIPFIGVLFSLANFIITGPLLGGVYYYVFRVMRRQPADIGAVFNGFSDNLGQLILGHVVPTLIAGATAIPGIVMAVIPTVIMAENEQANAALIAIAVVGFLLAMVPLIYFSVAWAFTIPLIVDKRLDFWPAMKASRAQVGRHWWTVFGLVIVASILNILGLFACCIGLFVTMPLFFVTVVLAYEILFVPRTGQPGAGA
jgi:hypothetical protein